TIAGVIALCEFGVTTPPAPSGCNSPPETGPGSDEFAISDLVVFTTNLNSNGMPIGLIATLISDCPVAELECSFVGADDPTYAEALKNNTPTVFLPEVENLRYAPQLQTQPGFLIDSNGEKAVYIINSDPP